jgi:hypothetical protein
MAKKERTTEVGGVILGVIIANVIGLGLMFLSMWSLVSALDVSFSGLASWQIAAVVLWGMGSGIAFVSAMLLELGVISGSCKAIFINGFRIGD